MDSLLSQGLCIRYSLLLKHFPGIFMVYSFTSFQSSLMYYLLSGLIPFTPYLLHFSSCNLPVICEMLLTLRTVFVYLPQLEYKLHEGRGLFRCCTSPSSWDSAWHTSVYQWMNVPLFLSTPFYLLLGFGDKFLFFTLTQWFLSKYKLLVPILLN